MGACQYRHTKCRGMSSTALCRYMSYTVMYIDICMQGTRLGPYMSHILARLDLPHITYTTPGDVCYAISRHGQGRSPYVTGTMMVILLIILDSFSRNPYLK